MSGQRVAYIRVSSLDQNVGRQLDGVAVEGLEQQPNGQWR